MSLDLSLAALSSIARLVLARRSLNASLDVSLSRPTKSVARSVAPCSFATKRGRVGGPTFSILFVFVKISLKSGHS